MKEGNIKQIQHKNLAKEGVNALQNLCKRDDKIITKADNYVRGANRQLVNNKL